MKKNIIKILVTFILIVGALFTHDALATTPTKQSFTFTGALQTFTVPADVKAVWVAMSGGGGGGGGCANGCNTGGGNGGGGGTNIKLLFVNPGDTLNVIVGKGGGGGGANSHNEGTGAGGGGGGASAVHLNNKFKIIAGGGGGGGGAHNKDDDSDNTYGYGGNGGTNGGGGGGGGGGVDWGLEDEDVGGNGGSGGFGGGGGGGGGIKSGTGGSGGLGSGIIYAGKPGIAPVGLYIGKSGGNGSGGALGGNNLGNPNTRHGGNGGISSTGSGFQQDNSVVVPSSRGGAGGIHDDNGYRYNNGSGCGYKSSCSGDNGFVDIYYSLSDPCPDNKQIRDFSGSCFTPAPSSSCASLKLVWSLLTNSCVNPLSVQTDDADNITQTTAILRGWGGLNNSTYPPGCTSLIGYSTTTGQVCNSENSITPAGSPSKMTAYFRYSKVTIPPIFCNDIYGINMVSTKDINLGTANSSSFYQYISNLSPDTIYYYCAIISNKDNIAYGGSSIVRKFHTSPLDTTIKTNNATRITSTSAVLNGSYSSVKNVKTYFKYKEDTIVLSSNPVKESILKTLINTALAFDDAPQPWKKVGEQNHTIGNRSNLYGNINFSLTGLKPSTRYLFMAVADDSKIFNGSTFNFTTSPSGEDGGRDEGDGRDGRGSCPTGWTGTYPDYCIPPGGGSCPTGWTGTYPNCIAPGGGTCPIGWTGTYPNCINPVSCTLPEVYSPSTNSCVTPPVCTPPKVLEEDKNKCITPPTPSFCEQNLNDASCLPGPGWTWNPNNGTWNGGNWNGGTWTGGNWNGGVWSGGVWSGGVWSGSGGIWSGGTWSNGVWTGGSWTGKLIIGQIATPPVDAVVHWQEGIEHVFVRQIVANNDFAKLYGYEAGTDLQTFAWNLADQFARAFGYISNSGREIRVSQPDVAAYQLQLIGNKLTVYEYYYNKIVDIRNVTTVFKNASGYEYYFKKP